MTPEQRHQAIAKMESKRSPSFSPQAYFYRLAVTEFAGPLTQEERAHSDAAFNDLGYVRWFHGGLPGRAVGDLLLPANNTGSDPRGLGGDFPARVTHVYISHLRRVAERYATSAAGPVYEVEPIGPVELDPAMLRTGLLMREWGKDSVAWVWEPEHHNTMLVDWRCAAATVLGPG